MTEEQEEWRPVVGWEGLYEVSSLGRMKSLDRLVYTAAGCKRRLQYGKVLTPVGGTNGYPYIGLSRDGRRVSRAVHILVCEAFIGPRPMGCDAAHNDGNILNAAASNLRWATRKENMADCIRHGTRPRGERHGQAILTDEQVRDIRRRAFECQAALAQEFGVVQSCIANIINNKRRIDHLYTPPRGRRRGSTKLSKAQVTHLNAIPAGSASHAALAQQFGISRSRISQLRAGIDGPWWNRLK